MNDRTSLDLVVPPEAFAVLAWADVDPHRMLAPDRATPSDVERRSVAATIGARALPQLRRRR